MDDKIRKIVSDVLNEYSDYSLWNGYNRDVLAEKITEEIESGLGREIYKPRKMNRNELVEHLKKMRKNDKLGGTE